MNPAVDVIVDRDDDIATVKAIHSLAVRQRGVLVIHIAPATREEPAVVWAILRALGKRIERLDRPNLRVFWMDAERWLTAHRVREIVVLCAQHLGASVTEELKAYVSGRFRIALALIYSGRAAAKRAATTTLDAYLGKPRHPPQPDGRPRHWPQVPRSDPLRFRYDCWRQLAPNDFARVEGLLSRSMTPLSGWRASTELAGALTVVLAADDGEQAYVRRCGAELALAVNQVPIPKSLPPARYPQSPDPRHVETILSHTSPWTACYELAKLVTGLSDELLALIGGDQVTDDAILGCAVPEAARPILRAVNDGREPVRSFRSHTDPGPRRIRTTSRTRRRRRRQTRTTPQRWAGCCVAAARASCPASSRARSAHGSRHSELTAFSTGASASTEPATSRSTAAFGLLTPPIRALTNDWDDPLTRSGNPADI